MLGLILLTASSLPAQDSANDLAVSIEASRALYKTGEPVQVRVTLRNPTSQTISFYNQPPAQAVSLRIIDPSGRQVKPVGSPTQFMFGSTHMIRLKPGQEVTLIYRGKEWSDLREWGYDLQALGRYRMAGSSRAGGRDPAPGGEAPSKAETTFTIEK
jgi:hypothetical protein